MSLTGLTSLLPLHAEEGPVREVRSRTELQTGLARAANLTTPQAQIAVAIVERLFDAVGILDRRALGQGSWAFVSYPAYLLGCSIAEALSRPETRYVPAEYWEQGSHRPDAMREQQREVLHFLEEGRRQHSGDSPTPIRIVRVAWGLIRLGGRFLLRHREDKTRPGTKNFVLPGGRLSLADMEEPSTPRETFLRLESDVLFAHAALERTLKRELTEEILLLPSQDYVWTEWRPLKAFHAVEGTGNSHALTKYQILLYTIRLTPAGEVKLYDLVAGSREQFCWFGAKELSEGRLPDGRLAYVDAIIADWGAATEEILSSVPDSAGITYRFDKATDAIDLPIRTDQWIRRGKTGKEKELGIVLDQEEIGVLLAFGWHAKSPGILEVAHFVVPLPNGWLKIGSTEHATRITRLIQKLEAAGLTLLEGQQAEYFRLSIDPQLLYFHEDAFRYRLEPHDEHGRDFHFTLQRPAIETPLGRIRGQTERWNVTRNIQRIIDAVAGGKDPSKEPLIKSGDIDRSLRDFLDSRAQPLGLRKVIRESNAQYAIAIRTAD